MRHRERNTWEIPGGHREEFETCQEAAKRELFEETGARVFDLQLVCGYSVNRGQTKSYGQLYYADVKELAALPESEIREIKTVTHLPDNLTYPLIQPVLCTRVLEHVQLG